MNKLHNYSYLLVGLLCLILFIPVAQQSDIGAMRLLSQVGFTLVQIFGVWTLVTEVVFGRRGTGGIGHRRRDRRSCD